MPTFEFLSDLILFRPSEGLKPDPPPAENHQFQTAYFQIKPAKGLTEEIKETPNND